MPELDPKRAHQLCQLVKERRWTEYESLLKEWKEEIRDALEVACGERAIALLQGEVRAINNMLGLKASLLEDQGRTD